MEIKLSEFEDMLSSHDWFYNYSDDHRAYQKGNDESKAIRRAYEELAKEGFEVEARELFNTISPDDFFMVGPKKNM